MGNNDFMVEKSTNLRAKFEPARIQVGKTGKPEFILILINLLIIELADDLAVFNENVREFRNSAKPVA